MGRLLSFLKASGLSRLPLAYARGSETSARSRGLRAPREGAVANSWLGHDTVNRTALLWILTGCLVCPAARALTVPAGTEVQIRLKTKVSTTSSHAKDPVEAVVIAPVMVDGQFAVPAGAAVRGAVAKVTPSSKPDERAVLALSFTTLEFGGTKLTLAARLTDVDNAREKVDDQGQVQGILASDTITGKLDEQIGKVTEKYAGLGGFLNGVKSAVLKPAEGDITYDAGVEMTLRLTAPLVLKSAGGRRAQGPPNLRAMPNEAALAGPGGWRAVPDGGAEAAQALGLHQPDAHRQRGGGAGDVSSGRMDRGHQPEPAAPSSRRCARWRRIADTAKRRCRS